MRGSFVLGVFCGTPPWSEAAAVNPVRGMASTTGRGLWFRGGRGVLVRHMRIHLTDRHLIPSLLTFMREHVHVTADRVGLQEIEVSQLGSQHAAGRRLELDLLLQTWGSSHASAETRILD